VWWSKLDAGKLERFEYGVIEKLGGQMLPSRNRRKNADLNISFKVAYPAQSGELESSFWHDLEEKHVEAVEPEAWDLYFSKQGDQTAALKTSTLAAAAAAPTALSLDHPSDENYRRIKVKKEEVEEEGGVEDNEEKEEEEEEAEEEEKEEEGGGKEPKIPAEDPVLPSVEQLQGTVPHLGETSAGLPTKQVAVAARPQGPPMQAAKGKMPVGNNTAAKGPMDHFLKPTNTLQPQGAQLSQRAREKMPVGRLAQTEKTETRVEDILKISEALSGSMADYPQFADALSRNHGNVTDAISYLLNQAAARNERETPANEDNEANDYKISLIDSILEGNITVSEIGEALAAHGGNVESTLCWLLEPKFMSNTVPMDSEHFNPITGEEDQEDEKDGIRVDRRGWVKHGRDYNSEEDSEQEDSSEAESECGSVEDEDLSEDEDEGRQPMGDSSASGAGSSSNPPVPGPSSFAEMSPDETKWLLNVCQFLEKRLSTLPKNGTDYSWLKLPWVTAPGDTAQILEAAYRSLSPAGVQAFVLANKESLTPDVFEKIMGVGRGGLIEERGLYWPSGPTLVATEQVNTLVPDGSKGVWLGACNGVWGNFKETLVDSVRKLDVYPMGGGVTHHPCDGHTQYASVGELGFIMYATSLPGPSFQPPAARLAIESLRDGGILVVTDTLGRDEATLSTFDKLLNIYELRGFGTLKRKTVGVPGQRDVDMLTFTRTSASGPGSGPVPMLKLPKRNRVTLYAAVLPQGPRTHMHPVVAPRRQSAGAAELDAKSTITSAPGCYMIATGQFAYGGASLNPVKRTAQHVQLHRSGNKGFARLLKEVHPNERAGVTRACIVFGYNEIHPEKIAQLLGGTPVTVRSVSFFLHFAEQLMLNQLMKVGWGGGAVPKLLNKTISGFAQGAQANASANGKLGTYITNWSKFTVEAPPTAMLLGKFTDDCRAEGTCVVATYVDKVITITRVSLPTGEAGGEREWEVVQRVATKTFGKCTSVARKLGSHVAHWSKFTVEAPPTAMLLGKFTDDCRSKGACVVATCDDKVITITRVSLPTGEAGGEREWEVVQRVATKTFGKCTSVAGKLGGKRGSQVTNWSKFTVEAPPTAMLLGKFTDGCRAEGACVVATYDDKVIMITSVSLPTGEAGGEREWEVVQRVATKTFGKCTSVAGKLGGKRGSQVSNWSKFTVEAPPTAMLLGKFTEDCRAEGACVVATCVDKIITITRVSLPTGAAGGEREWEVVQRVATKTFGKCTSSAAAANYAESKSNPAMSTNEAKSAGASKGVQKKGKGTQSCGMCGQVGVNSTTCPRNKYAAKPIHEDGRKKPRTRNGRNQRGGDGKHLYADYLV